MIEATAQFNAELAAVCAAALASRRASSCAALVETALTTFDGIIDVFVEHSRQWRDASSIATDSRVQSGPGTHSNATALDVVTLFRETLRVTPQDDVVVKIDIEGAEYPVLERALFHGLIPLWDEVYVEWHDTNPFIFAGSDKQAHYEKRRYCLDETLIRQQHGIGYWGRRR